MGDTTIEALRALYVALGGAEEDVAEITLIPPMIRKIAEVAANLNGADADAQD